MGTLDAFFITTLTFRVQHAVDGVGVGIDQMPPCLEPRIGVMRRAARRRLQRCTRLALFGVEQIELPDARAYRSAGLRQAVRRGRPAPRARQRRHRPGRWADARRAPVQACHLPWKGRSSSSCSHPGHHDGLGVKPAGLHWPWLDEDAHSS